MSSNSYTYSSSSSVSYSTTSSSSTRNGHTTTDGARYMSYTTSDPSGTTTHTASQRQGGPVYAERRDYDASGRLLPVGGGYAQPTIGGSGVDASRRIEDVTEGEKKQQK
ncbi:hypothetical protein F4810DRAFT_160882 [Camillea tinctor]|nr:hypothetical protein F4810DRAFT_160882 [Camillea tinctor]